MLVSASVADLAAAAGVAKRRHCWGRRTFPATDAKKGLSRWRRAAAFRAGDQNKTVRSPARFLQRSQNQNCAQMVAITRRPLLDLQARFHEDDDVGIPRRQNIVQVEFGPSNLRPSLHDVGGIGAAVDGRWVRLALSDDGSCEPVRWICERIVDELAEGAVTNRIKHRLRCAPRSPRRAGVGEQDTAGRWWSAVVGH